MHRVFLTTVLLIASALAGAADTAPAADRHAKGEATLDKITGGGAKRVLENLNEVAPDLAHWIVDFAYGDVVSRPQLELRTRELVTVGALTALGNAAPQLKAHVNGALNAGAKPEEVVEVVLQMAVYAGFPAALNGINVVKDVFTERGIKITAGP